MPTFWFTPANHRSAIVRFCRSLLSRDYASRAIVLEQVSDFSEQLNLCRRARSGRGRLLLFQRHDPFDGEEQHPGDDEKVQRDGKKLSPAEDRTLLLRVDVGQ